MTCVKMCMVQRKMELRERVKDGEVDDRGDLKLVPCSKKSRAEDGSSRAHAACFEALINAGADVDQWDGEGLAPIHHAAKNGDAGCVRFLCGSCSVSLFFLLRVPREPPDRLPRRRRPRPRSRPSGSSRGAGLRRVTSMACSRSDPLPLTSLHRAEARRWRTGEYRRTPPHQYNNSTPSTRIGMGINLHAIEQTH